MAKHLSKIICELLSEKTGFVIATIISHTGSTPRTSGTRMLITAEGGIIGTVGGGLLEARVIEKALEILESECGCRFMPFDLNHEDVASMDMICGGQAEIFLDPIPPVSENAEIFSRWNRILEKREKGYFITTIGQGPEKMPRVCHGIIDGDGLLYGGLPLSQEEVGRIILKAGGSSSLKVDDLHGLQVIIEPAQKPKTAFLFGAGHVAKPTAHLCAMTGFWVTVLDDRAEFANAEHFPEAQEIRILESFENAFDDLSIDPDSFIVIFTRGHLHDRIVLAQALKTEAAYIGMIGSRKKRDSIYKALLNIGFEQKDIDRVHCPIGLPIRAQSPEEIAVSIAAEMIQARSRMSE